MKTSRQEKKFRKKVDPDPDLLEQLNEAIGHKQPVKAIIKINISDFIFLSFIYLLITDRYRFPFANRALVCL